MTSIRAHRVTVLAYRASSGLCWLVLPACQQRTTKFSLDYSEYRYHNGKISLDYLYRPKQALVNPASTKPCEPINIKSAIDFEENFHQPLAVVQIDFYKAFVSVFHQFLLQTACQLGIPSSLLKWIRIFLSNLISKINLNRYLSNSIPVKRGIRQGCPLSMLLFIIAIEPLTRKILASANFKGISLGKTTLKVSHFADDLTLFITHPSSFSTLLEILNQFSLFSGLKINHDKTTIISNSPDLISSFQSNFPGGKILQSTKILGIFFSFKTDLLMQNWDALVRSVPRTTLTLLNPNDSLFSKVISINQHSLPKILFLSRIIPPHLNT